MAPNATIYRLELQASDMDRHYYAEHALTLAQHPSETPERLMARLIAFVLFADERLEFGRGLSNEEDPALWQRDYGGEIEHWIDLGQPDESRIRKACGRARQVTVVNYGGHASELWWNRQAAALGKLKNLSVIDLDSQAIEAALPLLERSMRLTSMIQDGELQLMNESISVALTPRERMPAAA